MTLDDKVRRVPLRTKLLVGIGIGAFLVLAGDRFQVPQRTKQAYVEKCRVTYHDGTRIEGNRKFRDRVVEAREFLKQNNPEEYAAVVRNIANIFYSEDKKTATVLSTGEYYIPTSFTEPWTDRAKIYLASAFTNDALHITLLQQGVGDRAEREKLAAERQKQVLDSFVEANPEDLRLRKIVKEYKEYLGFQVEKRFWEN